MVVQPLNHHFSGLNARVINLRTVGKDTEKKKKLTAVPSIGGFLSNRTAVLLFFPFFKKIGSFTFFSFLYPRANLKLKKLLIAWRLRRFHGRASFQKTTISLGSAVKDGIFCGKVCLVRLRG